MIIYRNHLLAMIYICELHGTTYIKHFQIRLSVDFYRQSSLYLSHTHTPLLFSLILHASLPLCFSLSIFLSFGLFSFLCPVKLSLHHYIPILFNNMVISLWQCHTAYMHKVASYIQFL